MNIFVLTLNCINDKLLNRNIKIKGFFLETNNRKFRGKVKESGGIINGEI